jgi:hypothetical protein
VDRWTEGLIFGCAITLWLMWLAFHRLSYPQQVYDKDGIGHCQGGSAVACENIRKAILEATTHP